MTLPPPDPDMHCCMASALHPESCTCWRPILVDLDRLDLVDVESLIAQIRADAPSAVLEEGPPAIRRMMCSDCAYRPGSPERADNDGQPPDYRVGDRFYCHDGMPSVVAWVHPSGAVTRVQERADYAPVMRSDRAWRHDGRPGVLCAGWAARNGLPRSA